MTIAGKQTIEEGVVLDPKVEFHSDPEVRKLYRKTVRILPETIEDVFHPKTKKLIGQRAEVFALNLPMPNKTVSLMLSCITPIR